MKMFPSGPTSIIAGLYDDLRIGDTIDALVDWDREKSYLSPGLRIKAIIINMFCGRKPLYRLHEGYEYLDTENLFGAGVHPEDLKDYSIARALDKVSEANARKVFSSIAMQVVADENISIKTLHADTTSISVEGIYETDDEQADFQINHGHSKNHRPDLKQFKYGLGVTKDKIPVMGNSFSGNIDDKTWNYDFIKEMRNQFDPKTLKDMVYIADSALITKSNLEAIARIPLQGDTPLRFISRLPGTFSKENELIEKAFEKDRWEEFGTFSEKKDAAVYKGQEFISELYQDNYNFIVVHSSKFDGRKQRGLNTRLDKKEKELEKEAKKLEKDSFACQPDALLAWEKFKKEHGDKHFQLEVSINQEVKKGPGRPSKKQMENPEHIYRIEISIRRDKEAIEQTKQRLSCFVLITNILEGHSAYEILKEYKEQFNVEMTFKFLKDPIFVGAIYLKKPERVEALSYVFLIALLMFYILERRVRKAMEKEEEPLIIPGKVETFKPTGVKILQSFEFMMVHTTENPMKRAFPANLRIPERLLCLAGLTPEIYLRVLPPPNKFPEKN